MCALIYSVFCTRSNFCLSKLPPVFHYKLERLASFDVEAMMSLYITVVSLPTHSVQSNIALCTYKAAVLIPESHQTLAFLSGTLSRLSPTV